MLLMRLNNRIFYIFYFINLPFYLAFPTGIYLFQINNKIRTILCEICPELTRKEPDQMYETKFLQMS